MRDLAQPALRAIHEQPNAHTTGDQPHVMSQEVLPFFQGGQGGLLGDDLGGVVGVGVIRVKVVGMAMVSVTGWLIVIPLFMSPVVGGVRSAPLAVSPRRFAERLIPVLTHLFVRSSFPPSSPARMRQVCVRDRRDRSYLPGTSSVV